MSPVKDDSSLADWGEPLVGAIGKDHLQAFVPFVVTPSGGPGWVAGGVPVGGRLLGWHLHLWFAE